MKILNKIKNGLLLIVVFAFVLSGCNKLDLDPTPTPPSDNGTTPTLATLLDAPEFSLLKAAATKAKLIPVLSSTSVRYTVFAPDNAAIIASLGVPDEATAAGYIASLTEAQVTGLVSYHVIPQVIGATSISSSFPNFEYPSILNPAPSVSPLLRLSTFPSRRGAFAWVNNVPVTAANVQAVNGVLHKVARLVAPPQIDLWARIQNDPELKYLQAAIARADEGVPAGGRLQDALNTAVNPLAIASNLTVFAPTDAAMAAFVTGALTQAFVANSIPLANAQAAAGALVAGFGPTLLSAPGSIPDVIPGVTGLGAQLAAVITPTLAKGIVAYHILGSQSGTYGPPGIRVFSVNIPTTATAVKTLLNSGVAVHPGVTVQSTFAPGLPVVAAITVKGAANATASNVIMGLPTSDIHTVNGVMHKIDQVLLPQ